MFSSSEKSVKPSTVVQRQPYGGVFFRKAQTSEDSFFGSREQAAFFSPPIQTKLNVSNPDDPQEKEAESVASEVMRMSEPVASPPAVDQGGSEDKEEIDRKENDKVEPVREDEITSVQRKTYSDIFESGITRNISRIRSTTSSGKISRNAFRNYIPIQKSRYLMRSGRGPPERESSESSNFEQSLSSSRGQGGALPETTRSTMENRFCADFSGVRIHTGQIAQQLNRQIDAQAFTCGNDIYFNQGAWSPQSAKGMGLIAHELTHTIQQGASRPSTSSVSPLRIKRKIQRSIQRIQAESQRNRAVTLAKGEEGKVSAKQTGPDGFRIGWDRLLEYFKATFGPDRVLPEGAAHQENTVSEGHIKKISQFRGNVIDPADGHTVLHNQLRDAMPSWCGIFAFWALNKAGIPLRKWRLGGSVITPDAAYPKGHKPVAGDIAYRREFSHYALVASSDGVNVTTINGNTSGIDNLGGAVQEHTHTIDHWYGFFDPTMIMEGSLRSPGSNEGDMGVTVRSLRELRKQLFNVQRSTNFLGLKDDKSSQIYETAEKSGTSGVRDSIPIGRAVVDGSPLSKCTSAPTLEIQKKTDEKIQEKEPEEHEQHTVQLDRAIRHGALVQRSVSTDASVSESTQEHEKQPDSLPIQMKSNRSGYGSDFIHRQISIPQGRGPPLGQIKTISRAKRSIVQRSWLGNAWNAVSGLAGDAARFIASGLDAAKEWMFRKVRDFVRNIPGYRIVCLLLGDDPITGEPAPMTGVNLLNAGLDVLPGGYMFRFLMQSLNIFNDVATWLDGRIEDMRSLVSGISNRFTQFWESLTLDSIREPGKILDRVSELLRSSVEGVTQFFTNSISQFLSMIKRVMIREIAAFVRARIPSLFPLLTVALGFNPETMEKVERNGTNILNAFLEVSEAGREQRRQMIETGSFQKVVSWIDRGIAVFSRAYMLLRQAIAGIWDYVTVDNLYNPTATLTRIWNQFTEPVSIVGQFLIDAAKEILKIIKNALLSRLSEWAKRQRGYSLICVIIGKDPFTNEVVPRTVHNLVKGFLSLQEGGEEQYEQLRESGAIDRIVNKVEAAVARLNMTPAAIVQLFMDLWKSLSIYDLVNPIEAFHRIVATFGRPIMRLIAFVIEIVMIVIEAILILMNFPFALISNIINKARQAFQLIKRDPAAFFKNLLNAIKQGFIQFFDNILTHLWNGLKQWFLGEVKDAGIPIPTDFTFLGIIKWLLEVLGITLEKIWKKLEERIGKEKVQKIKRIVSIAEKVVGAASDAIKFVEDVRQRGLVAVIGEKILEKLSDVWNMVLQAVQSFVMEQIIRQVTIKLLSMLDPTGIMAVVNSAIALYKAIQSFIKYLTKMLEIVNSFVEGVLQIAQGSIATAANFLENALARGIPVVIGFLANQVGLNLSSRLKDALELVRAKVDQGLTWVVDRLVTIVERLVAMGRSAVASVRRLMGLEKRFTANDGKQHKVYIGGSVENPVIMVQSNPTAFADFLKVTEETENNKKPKDETRLAKIKIARTKGKAIDKKREEMKGKSEDEIVVATTPLLNDIAETIKELFGDGTDAVTKVDWTTQSGTKYGKTMKAVRLNKKYHTNGQQPTSAKNESFKTLNERRDVSNPDAAYYIKGHLLNQELGGKGEWENLTPLSRSGNAQHETAVESLVKAAVNSNTVVQYDVTVNYGRSVNEELFPGTDIVSTKKREIVKAEKNVPLSLSCKAYTMIKNGDNFQEKDVIVNNPVENTIEETAESYRLKTDAPPTISYEDLRKKIEALISAPATWDVYKEGDALVKNSYEILKNEEKTNIQTLYNKKQRLIGEKIEDSKIDVIKIKKQITSWISFTGGRKFYETNDEAYKKIKKEFDKTQNEIKKAALDSARSLIPKTKTIKKWIDFKTDNSINFTVKDPLTTLLQTIETEFRNHQKSISD